MEKLKPCPLCGRPPKLNWRGSMYTNFLITIECQQCCLTMEYEGYHIPLEQAKKEAASRWNTRLA